MHMVTTDMDIMDTGMDMDIMDTGTVIMDIDMDIIMDTDMDIIMVTTDIMVMDTMAIIMDERNYTNLFTHLKWSWKIMPWYCK